MLRRVNRTRRASKTRKDNDRVARRTDREAQTTTDAAAETARARPHRHPKRRNNAEKRTNRGAMLILHPILLTYFRAVL